MSRSIFSALALLFFLNASSQNVVIDSLLFDPHISVSYAYQIPGGDMAKRYGNNHNIGFGFHIKSRNSWYYGVQMSYLFGSHVIQPKGFLDNLELNSGYILDNDGQYAKLSIQERGWTVTLNGGKLFNVIGPNKNSGILVYGGLGFMQHKIRIEHQESHIQQLEKDYLKGYDRLVNGPMITGFAGYYHMGNNRFINFCIGLEWMQGITQPRRDLNFDTMTADTGSRNDALLGIRGSWTLHLYRRMSDNHYYY